MRKHFIASAIWLLIAGASSARAEGFSGADQGKLLLTAGFSTLEGAGGGALTPFAFIAGYGSEDSWGANFFGSDVQLRDVELRSFGAAVGALDRVEVSFARQQLDVHNGALDGLGVSVDVAGVKVRVFGNAVYGQDSWAPQVAVGAQYKRHRGIENFPLASVLQLGARDAKSVDYYVSATKLSLSHSFLLNVTLRATEANQIGLLGFGGDQGGYSVRFETTAAYLFSRSFALGGEFRSRPRNLSVDEEIAAWDLFMAWAPCKHFSIVAAYANVGSLLTPVTADEHDQDGSYVSMQFGF